MDNSPMWDQIMERLQLRPDQIPQYRRADIHFVAAGDRPLDAAYDRFAYFVKLFADRDHDETRIRDDFPFLVPGRAFQRALVSGREGSGADRACFERGSFALRTARCKGGLRNEREAMG
jgi:hypothetical protein